MEVEHYRPKGRVRGGDRLGYWWLALEWSNLLPSCIDCNRTRRHRIATLAADGTVTYAEVVAGKWDQFPIAGAHRATSAEDDLSLEAALLIDPTREDPDAHLRWIVEHLHLPIAAAALVGRQEDPRGRSSIDVLALNREGLIEERAALLQEIALDVARIRKVLVTSLAVPEESRADVLKLAVDQLAELNRHAHPERPFSSIATAFIRQEKQKLRDEFSALLADEF